MKRRKRRQVLQQQLKKQNKKEQIEEIDPASHFSSGQECEDQYSDEYESVEEVYHSGSSEEEINENDLEDFQKLQIEDSQAGLKIRVAPEQKKKKEEQKQVFNKDPRQLGRNELMDYDENAYEMLHRCKCEWPCLSVDVVSAEDTDPLTVYLVAGSQSAKPADNKLYVMR